MGTIENQCRSNEECPHEQACIRGQCVDPCRIRGVCGKNAVCRVMFHKPWCSCPQCHLGKPTELCSPDPNCDGQGRPMTITKQCHFDSNCPQSLACNQAIGACENPCTWKTRRNRPLVSCSPNHKCEVKKHKPMCVCKTNLVMNDRFELTCSTGTEKECILNQDCPDNLACQAGECRSPCFNERCEPGKTCQVINHKPYCFCNALECKTSASICLKDAGCPSHLACVGYKCQDPCENLRCGEGTPCYVEDHKAACKFCPNGWIPDSKYGCKGKQHTPFELCWKLVY